MEEKPENPSFSSTISESSMTTTTTSLFPLFPISNKSLESSQSQQSEWLSNTSFTTDFSIVNQSISSHIQILKQSDQFSESNSDEDDESIHPNRPSYKILKSSESDSESDDSTRRSKKKKKKRKKKGSEKTAEYGGRKRGVRAWDDSATKPEKGYYFDSRGDQDNLTYGSLYRMDVARYKPLQSNELRGVNTQFLRSSKQRGSLLDVEQDTDVVDEKLKSGGRYWSTKYSVLERHKDFKRVKIAASTEPIEFSEFLPLTSDDEDESGPTSNAVEESWEDEVLRKTREFNKMTRESPHDEKVWLAFAEFQDKVASRQPQKGARLQTLEKKISILQKAIELNPDNEEILLFLMKAFQSRDNTEVLIERWEKILVQRSGSYKLWREFLRVIQGDFSKFKVSEARKMYAHAIQALSEACLKLSRQGHQSTMQRHDIIQLELGLVDIFVSFCRFEWQSGYQELATALFQAEIEFTLFCPSLSLTEQSRLRLFEHFWNGNCARVGEDGALGWSMWLAKEEEDRRKVVVEESAEEDKGGWTGWSEPSLTNKGVSNNPEGLEDNDLIENGVEQALETEDVQQEDDIEYLMKKMGIDVDGDVDCEVKDPSTWIRWSEEELSRDREQWMPMREQSVLPDEPSEREGDEQLLRVILFEDICEYLCTLSSEEARFSLLSQFIDFFGGKISHWGCTNSSSWIAKILSLETFSDSILDDLKKVEEIITQVQSDSSSLTWESLLGSSFDISSRTSMMKFLRNAVSLCLTAFPRNYILEEAALTSEELFTTKMNSHICGTTPSRALAKVLLKNDRQDLLLCGVYARKEAAFGNHDVARKVFDMALSSVTELPLDLQSNIPLLYLWYAEMELSIISNEGSESASSRAVHILSCLGSGVKYSVYKSQPSSPQLLRARQGFKERMRMLLATWAHGDIKDGPVAFICAAALFEDLTSGQASGADVIKGAFSMVLPERRSQSTQMESLFNHYIKILEKHYKQSNPSRVFSSIVEGLQIYPYNSKLFSSFLEIGRLHTVPNKIRRMFDEFCHNKPSVISWLFALAYELGKAGSQHRIHALFERALSDDRLRDSVILWRCYIAYEVDIACNPKSARRIYFRAINACPWSKKLWLDGFRKLSSILSAKELSDLQEVMRDKEMNLRTDIYEILLQDDINP